MSTPKKPDFKDLPATTTYLLTTGPVKTHAASPRRLRIVHKGSYIADTTDAYYVWEHPYYPYFYLPKKAFSADLKWAKGETKTGPKGEGSVVTLEGKGGWKTDRVIWFEKGNEAWCNDMVRVEFGAVDQWFEEDVPTLVHPKDPFKRIDCLPSLRHIRVTVPSASDPSKEIELASTPQSIHLHEAMLPVRYYMPVTAIKPQYLRKSSSKSFCPYKGEAEYYDIVIPGENGAKETVINDLVWYYDRPNLEVAVIEKLACFWAEKVDLWIDGEKIKKPANRFG